MGRGSHLNGEGAEENGAEHDGVPAEESAV